jgi:hypothetical protein
VKVCGKGHEYRGDENYRARKGWCPVCFKDVQRRYAVSEKGKANRRRYDQTEKGRARFANRDRDKLDDARARYDQSPKGWMNGLRKRRSAALRRRKLRKEAEDSSGTLSP